MRVDALQLRNFRVHQALDLTIPGHVLMIGPNGVGKTSILEGLHVLAVGRTFRRVPDEHLVRHGASSMEALGALAWHDMPHRVECRIVAEVGKRLQVDGRTLTRLAELVESTSVVTTTSDDILLVEGSPSHARRWLDLFACQQEPGLLSVLVRYAQVLRQRNALLGQWRDGDGRDLREALEPWTAQMFELGRQIEARRIALVRAVEALVPLIYERVAGCDADVRLVYGAGIRADSLEGLKGVLRQEVARGHSLWGPHRAGLEVMLGGVPVKAFASRGEKRSVAFALKIAQARLMREAPLCLVDDLALELDARRSGEVVRLFMDIGQVVTTSSHRERVWPDDLAVMEIGS